MNELPNHSLLVAPKQQKSSYDSHADASKITQKAKDINTSKSESTNGSNSTASRAKSAGNSNNQVSH